MKRSSLAVVVTMLVALAAAAAVFMYVQNVRQDATRSSATVAVLVSTVGVPAGQDLDPLIAQGVFVTKRFPQDALVTGYISDVYQLKGQRTAYPILAGEQISAARLRGALTAPGGELGIPKGMQAASLTLERQRVAGGAVREGDHVEAYGTFTLPGASQGQITRVLVSDAQVLAVHGADPTTGASDAITITLAVAPVGAEMLVYGQETGHVWLTLLPPNEAGAVVPPVRSKEIR
jgi:pilus assembly protein CpaB